MDFARKQLEKYGWKDGDGLGKTSQGIVVAIKPRLKTGKEGMGFDLCQELTGTWWTKAYSDSLSRINIKGNTEEGESLAVSIQEDEEVGGGTEKGPYAAEERPMEKMRKRMMKANFTSFSKGGTLSNGEWIAEDSPPESNSNSGTATPVIKYLNDEELLKACGGRTAHKAARFGLKLNGKLARIAAQEQIHLNSIPTTDSPDQEEMNNNETVQKKAKKNQNKRKHKHIKDSEADIVETNLIPQESEEVINENLENNSDVIVKKRKKSKIPEIKDEFDEESIENKPKKTKKSKDKGRKSLTDQES